MEQLFIGGLGTSEILLIVVVLLLLFGGKKLPELMRGAGRGIKEFKENHNYYQHQRVISDRNIYEHSNCQRQRGDDIRGTPR